MTPTAAICSPVCSQLAAEVPAMWRGPPVDRSAAMLWATLLSCRHELPKAAKSSVCPTTLSATGAVSSVATVPRFGHDLCLKSHQRCVVHTCSPSGSKAVQPWKPSKDAAAASAKSVSSQQSAQASDYSPSLSTQQTSEEAVTNAAASSDPCRPQGARRATPADVSSAAGKAAAPARAGRDPATTSSRQQPLPAEAATASQGQGATGQDGCQSKQEQPFQVFPGILPAVSLTSCVAKHECTLCLSCQCELHACLCRCVSARGLVCEDHPQEVRSCEKQGGRSV